MASAPSAQSVGLILDSVFERHDTGPGHPEHPGRLAAIRDRLVSVEFAGRCDSVEPVAATDEQLCRLHHPDYLVRAREVCHSGANHLDSMDVAVGRESEQVARLAAGSLVDLCRKVADGDLRRGFAAMRPPGHHAEHDLAMGFCLYNNVAVAARALQVESGLERIAIVDFDVHHGNGTQHLFEDDASVFFASTHQWPLYPGTGSIDERGKGDGEGYTLNCPLAPGSGDEEFLAAMTGKVIPAVEAFGPDFLLVSAGFDAHRADPLAQLSVSTEAYGAVTTQLIDLAERSCEGRLVSTLEGGYDVPALIDSVELHLRTLLGR